MCPPTSDSSPGSAGPLRTFATGATRTADSGRIDPEGFLSPLAVQRYSEYLHKHRFQADGVTRDSDNWQRGVPLDVYMKSAWRHFLHWWTRHRGWTVSDPQAGSDIEEDLCAVIFNAQGYLHELVGARSGPGRATSGSQRFIHPYERQKAQYTSV